MEPNQAKLYDLTGMQLAAFTKEAAVQAKSNLITVIREFNITAEDINALHSYLNDNKAVFQSAINDAKTGKFGISTAMNLLPKLFKKK